MRAFNWRGERFKKRFSDLIIKMLGRVGNFLTAAPLFIFFTKRSIFVKKFIKICGFENEPFFEIRNYNVFEVVVLLSTRSCIKYKITCRRALLFGLATESISVLEGRLVSIITSTFSLSVLPS